MRFHYVEVLFHMFYFYWGNENHWFIRKNLLYIEACYIKVPLYVHIERR